jgi:predicted RND superfamily exporter protein
MHGLISESQAKNSQLSIVNCQLSILASHKTAILLSAIVLITTVSSMLIAQHPAIRSVGFTTLVGLLSAVILSYVLQPALWRMINRQS